MSDQLPHTLRAILEFSRKGDLQKVSLLTMNEEDELLLWKHLKPGLKAYHGRARRRRRALKRTLVWAYNHQLLPQKVTQGLFDLFRLKAV